MSSARYKTLLSYLPGMASVVNSFQSEQVQIAVFDRLMSALEERAEFNETSASEKPKPAAKSSEEVAHDLIEGESIHTAIDSDM